MLRKISTIVKRSIRLQSDRNTDKATVDYDPQPLPTQRPRALTLTSQIEDTVKSAPRQTALDQSSSLFFKLPPELRDMIYVYAIGGNRLHIRRQFGRLAHVKCIVPGATSRDTRLHKCWGPLYPPDIDGYHPDEKGDWGLLSLLKTCRLV